MPSAASRIHGAKGDVRFGLEINRSTRKGTLCPKRRHARFNGSRSMTSWSINEQIYRAIETRQDELVERKPRVVEVERPIGPVPQLEAWFGDDYGAALSVGDKKQALALLRMLEVGELRELSATALVGAARLQTSVGMLSRACSVYRVLLACHPEAPIAARAAADALELAFKLRDRAAAEELARLVAGNPGLLGRHADLAALRRAST